MKPKNNAIEAAKKHFVWRVSVGNYRKDSRTGEPDYDQQGFGCMVRSNVVLTSFRVWQASQFHYDPIGPSVVSGQKSYACQLGWADEKSDISLLIINDKFCDLDEKEIKEFPSISSELPFPGMSLGTLCELGLEGIKPVEFREARGGLYHCFSYGFVSLIQGKGEILFALAGVLTSAQKLAGSALFNNEGQIVGVITDYLFQNPYPIHPTQYNGPCYIVFYPTVKALENLPKLKLLK